MRTVNETMNTSGCGYWSLIAREVTVTGLDVPYIADIDEDEGETEPQFGELRVYFDTTTWDTAKHGLIYTDKGFIAELHDYLTRAGYDASGVGYSQQGMQGDDYVSLDVDAKFLRAWMV